MDNSYYGGASYSSWPSASVGNGLNDRASSATSTGSAPTYYEDINCRGRTLTLSGNIQDLTSRSDNLHWGETWNDRVSSFDYFTTSGC